MSKLINKLVDKVKSENTSNSSSSADDDDLTPAQTIARDYSGDAEDPEAVPVAVPNEPLEAADTTIPNPATTSPGRPASINSAVSIATQSEEKRIVKWQDNFSELMDPDEQLISDYGCALRGTILIQGRLYVSQRHIAFGSNIVGLKRRIFFAIADITDVRKILTAKLIPNGLSITAKGETYSFASLNSREATYELITGMWKAINPEAYAAFLTAEGDAENEEEAEKEVSRGDRKTHAATQSGTKPFSETVLDIRLPTSPEKAYELMFKNEEFHKKFSTETMKLKDLEVEPWSGDKLQTRSFSYIKPLNNSVGPKQTHCKIDEEELHVDPETYFEVLTVTHTPDVPSGDIFQVNTKSSVSWAGGSKGGTRVLVTTECEWSGRSMLKGTITKASIAGQREYHKALAKELRAHIKANPQEFKTSESSDDADDELEEDDTPEGKEQSLLDSFTDLPNNPAALLLAVISILLLLSNIYLLVRSRKFTTPIQREDMLPRSALDALDRLERLEDFVSRLRQL